MKAYSEDLRLRIIAALDGGMSRSAAARVFGVGRAVEAIWAALRAITPDDARGYFIHAGYPPLAQLA